MRLTAIAGFGSMYSSLTALARLERADLRCPTRFLVSIARVAIAWTIMTSAGTPSGKEGARCTTC